MAAIYMWVQVYEEEYTTTLYPLEVSDALLLSIDLGDENYMAPIDGDSMTQGHELVAISLLQLLLSAPEQTDSIKQGHELVAVSVYPLLLAAPEQTDSMTQGHELVNLTVVPLLITTYMPDQGILYDIDLVPGSCYMTSV